jgi:trans-aconitate methyltransferase
MADPQGLAFDPVAEDYDRGRAGWPPELLDGVEADAVLDLGAGTGKLTRLLVERYAVVYAV